MTGSDLFGDRWSPHSSRWRAIRSSKTVEWATPDEVVRFWEQKLGRFALDVCATRANAKAERFYTVAQNGLTRDWAADSQGGLVWCNPPYGRRHKGWVPKAIAESVRGCTVVMLLPARTDTEWFHHLLLHKPSPEFWFCRGRIRFGDGKTAAPFPSAVVVLSPD